MKILRTIIWVLAFAAFLVFALYNWTAVEITLWENLVLETKVPVLALLAFALGFVPLWAYHLSVKWSLGRRIRTLENSLKSTALARHHEPHSAVAATGIAGVDTPVDKAGTKAGETVDPFAAGDSASDAGAGK